MVKERGKDNGQKETMVLTFSTFSKHSPDDWIPGVAGMDVAVPCPFLASVFGAAVVVVVAAADAEMAYSLTLLLNTVFSVMARL